QLAMDESRLRSTQFLAPCVPAGQVRTRLAGLVYRFTPQSRDLEGWGLFQPLDAQFVEQVGLPNLAQIEQYLSRFLPLRLRLSHRLRDCTWLAYPGNEADMHQRLGWVKPVVVHLVSAAGQFEQVISRWDGSSFWFEALDRRAEPAIAAQLQQALKQCTRVEDLNFKGLTPEMRTAYNLATQQLDAFSPQKQDQKRLQAALKIGGGELQQCQDQGDYWTVDWVTTTGEHHVSAIAKSDLTVISAGICLDGGDRHLWPQKPNG
ncbi:MAG: hypothetical protein F6K19_50330, partial [Cyanothece sp. SIO1E1]|nr:hypothetical protein [Cyanothece sp. SIO1E1]